MMQAPPPPAERQSADVLFKMYLAWEQAKTGENQEMWTAARYYHGKQYTDAELRIYKKRRQPPIVRNVVKRKVDFLVGVEQRLRRDPKAFPRNPQAEQVAPVATATLRSIEDANTWPALASECYRDAFIRGIGIQWAGIEIVKGKPEIKKRHVQVDRFFYDPRSERWDFNEVLYLGEHQWIDMEVAKEMLPWAAEMIEGLASAGTSQSMLPQLFAKEKNWHPWVDSRQRRIRLVSIWYKHKGEWLFDFLVGPISLCPAEPSKDKATGEEIPPMDCASPYLDENEMTTHPYEAWSPYVDEVGDRYGLLRDMMPIQDEINKRSSKALHLLSVRQTKGEKGAVDDIDAMKNEMARPEGHVEYKKGFAFEVIDQGSQIQGNLELLQEAKQEISDLGPNPGLAGRGVEDQSGRAILAQQNSGMTELSPVYERGREWKLRCYRKDWNLARQFYSEERFIRVSGDAQAAQHLKINVPVRDPMTGQIIIQNRIAEIDVDIILEEGPDTITMREELVQQLAQMGPEAVPPELLIELSNLPEKDAVLQKLAEFKSPPPEVKSLQARMAQLEELMKAAEIDKTVADTNAVQASAAKTATEAGIPIQALPQLGTVFPFFHREPNFLDRAQGMVNATQPPQMPQNALAGTPQGQQGLPPPNALGQEPPGAEASPDFLEASSTPWIPGEEPQLNQAGGLPMGMM